MKIFISKTSNVLNGKKLNTEFISDYICLSPKYRTVTVENANAKILLDSGAFQDTKKETRLTFEMALNRQLLFENKIKMMSDIIVAYDLIDCYETTLEANAYFLNMELGNRKKIIMTQGLTLDDYIFCLNENIDSMSNDNILGLGGISRAAINKKMQEKINVSILKINNTDIKWVHLFGVGSIKLLKRYREQLNENIELTCDSASFEIQSVMGRVLNENGQWSKKYTKDDKYINYHPCNLAKQNIQTAVNIIKRI